MAFLANKTVNRLHLHSAIYVLASAGGGVFFGAFLLKAGTSIPAILCAYALINLGRFCLRPLVLTAAKRVGLRPIVVFGTVLLGLQDPVLAQGHGVGWALLALCAVATLGETFYWTAYHTYYGQVGDAEHRGHQTSAREAVAAVVGIVAPVAGGWALATLGPQAAFGAVALVQILAVLPLLGMPNVSVPPEVEAPYVGVEPGFWMYLANGWIGAGTAVVWQVVLFVSLSQSFTAFGGAMALAALASAMLGLVLGRRLDGGKGVHAAWLSFAVLTVTIVLRAVADTPALAVAANAMGAFVATIYYPTHMTAAYNMAARAPCPLRFQMAWEAGWDIGRGAACLVAAGLIALGATPQATLLLSLIGVVAMLVLLRRYYAGVAAAVPA
jgi:hypothetical protein